MTTKKLAKGSMSPLKDRYFVYTNLLFLFYVILGVGSLILIDQLLKFPMTVFSPTLMAAGIVGTLLGFTKSIRALLDHVSLSRIKNRAHMNIFKKNKTWILNTGKVYNKNKLNKMFTEKLGHQLKVLPSTDNAAIAQIFVDENGDFSLYVAHSCSGAMECENPEYHVTGIPEPKEAS